MAARYFNWKLATVLVVAVGVFAVAAYALHRWQVNSRASQALPLGEAAYARQDWDEAAIQLGKYLGVNDNDVGILLKYAQAQRLRRPWSSANLAQVRDAYRKVLRLEEYNLEAAQGLMELYLSILNAPADAETVGRNYLKSRDDVGIRRLHAEALRLQGKPQEAAAELQKNLDQHPEDIQSYEMRGWLAKNYPEVGGRPAALWFDDAVTRNPQSALAYIARADFLFLQERGRDQALADLAQAQKCDLPDKETRSRLVEGLINARLLDQARVQLKAWHAQEPNEPLLWRDWAYLAKTANVPEEMGVVAEAGLEALAAQPWDFMPKATELLILSDHLEQAKSYITQMQGKGLAPVDVPVPYLEGLVAHKEGRLRDAVVAWRKALTLVYRRTEARYVRYMLADALARLGDVQSAIGELRILVTGFPGYLPGHFTLAQLLAQTRAWPEAWQEARQAQQLAEGYPKEHAEMTLLALQARAQLLAVDTGPAAEREKAWQEVDAGLAQLDKTGDGSLPAKLLQAQIALMRGKFPEAASLLTGLESREPPDVRAVVLHAELCAAQGQQEEAKSRLQAAVTKFPQALEPVRSLARLLDQQNQRPECETAIREGLARIQEPPLRRALGLDLAQLYGQWKQEDKLTQWLRELAQQFPHDILLRRWLLTRPEIVKDPRQAQGLVDEIKSLEGEDGCQYRYEQARLWYTDGNDFKAHCAQIVKLLQENLLANSRDYDSRLLLANTYAKDNQMPLAVATCQEAQRLAPNNVVVLARTVEILMRADDYPGARRLLDQGQQQNLHSPDLDRLRLQCDVRSSDLTRREDAWEKIASRDPNDVASRLNLALVRIQAKKYDEAQKILDALKAKTPELLEVLGVQVSLYVEQGKTDEALRLCDQMAEKLRSAPAYALRARVYIRLKQKLYESNPKDPDLKALRDYDEKALADFGRIIALDPQKAESWATRANYSHVIGRMREGLPDARKALELAPDNVAIQKLAVLLLIDASIEGHDSSLLGESGVLVDKVLAAFEKSPPTGTDDPRMRDYTELRLLKARVLMLKPATGPGLEEARRLLREVTTQQPKVAEAWQWLAQLELDQEDPAKAADLALQGLTYNPDDGRLLLLRARAEKARQPAVAALTLQGLLDRNPQNVEVLIELADAYTRANRAPQAAELLRQKLPEFAGRDRRLCEIALAEAVYASGQRDEAKALYEQLTQADPNNAAPTMSLAQRLRKDKRWTEMYQLVRRWLAAHPQDVDVAATIAQILAAAGDRQALQMGEDILRITLDRHPQALRPLGLLAMMMQDMGRNEEAARLYRKVLELDPKSAAALNNLAWILCDQEDHPDQYQEALELAARGLALVPESVDLLDTRGYACYRLGDFDKAAADFRRCIDLYPPNSPVAATPRYHLALVYSAMKRKAEAVGQLQQALGSNRTTIARTAKEQKDAGRVTYAIKLLKDALQLRDQMEPLRTALGLADDAGASTEQLAEAKGLLEELQKGI